MFLLGQNLGPYKRVYYALCKFDGVGLATATKLCNRSYIHPQCHVSELNDGQVERLKANLHVHLEARRAERMQREHRERNRVRPILPPGSVAGK